MRSIGTERGLGQGLVLALAAGLLTSPAQGADPSPPPATFGVVVVLEDATEADTTETPEAAEPEDKAACDAKTCDDPACGGCEACADKPCEEGAACEDAPCGDDAVAAEENTAENADEGYRATHRQVSLLKVNTEGLPERPLKTFCLAEDGRVIAACGDGKSGDVRLFNPSGDLDSSWGLPFGPEAINLGSDGNLYVAGAGKLARFTLDGELINQAEAPHAAAIRGDRDSVRKQVIKSHERQREWMQESVDDYEDQIEDLDEQIEAAEEKAKAAEAGEGSDDGAVKDQADADEGKVRRPRSIAAALGDLFGGGRKSVGEAKDPAALQRQKMLRDSLTQQLDMYQKMLDQQGKEKLTEEQIEQKIDASIAYKCRVASISEADGEVFLATGSQKGHGFAVWRSSRHFDAAEEIVTGLSGCCGQMDVQACCDGLFVAENSRARVAAFDRTGKSITSWGSRDRDGVEGFASCCNPMNVAFGSDGAVYTAESKVGRIKKYSPDGELLELVGKVDLIPGCDKVTIAVGPSGDRVYMLDITRNHIVVLERAEADDPVAYVEPKGESGPLGKASGQSLLDSLLHAALGK